MHLSKQEFNKLTRAEQRLLSNTRSIPKQRSSNGNGRGKKPRAPRRQNRGMQTQAFSNPTAAAVAYSTGVSTRAPSISMTRDRCRIHHRELVLSVVGTPDFAVGGQLAINPGMRATFPWLSIMARGWEQYEFKSLKFQYLTRASTGTAGSVLLVVDYDAADRPPATEQVASSYEGTVEDAPWKNMVLNVRKLSMTGTSKRHFVRSDVLDDNLDIKTYDVGNFFVCTTDSDSEEIPKWGKIYAEYDIEFTIPSLPPNGGIDLFGGLIQGNDTQTPLSPFGAAPNISLASEGIDMDNTSTLALDAPGTYVCSYAITGTGLTAFPSATFVGCEAVDTTQLVLADGTAGILVQTIVVGPDGFGSVLQSITGTTVVDAALLVGSMPKGSASP